MSKKFFIILFFFLLLTGCSREHHKTFQGYIEGRFNYLASNYSGTLTNLLVSRGTYVNKGQTLAILDAQPQKAALDQANESLQQSQGQYDQIKANLNLAEVNLSRYEILRRKDVIPQETLDTARANRDALKAQLQAANANLSAMKANTEQAKWSYGQKVITAPLEGLIFDNYYEVGDLVPANYPILGMLSPTNVYLIFFLPETLLSKIKIGDAVSFRMDSVKNDFTATVRYISPSSEYTPPVIYSQKSRQKLVYRIEAHIPNQLAKSMHPGQPVDVTITFK